MQTKNLVSNSLLRGLQMLFAIIVIGLSVTLIKTHNTTAAEASKLSETYASFPKAPTILSLAAAVGGLSLVAAVFNLCVTWTEFLSVYVETLTDVVVLAANVVVGLVSLRAPTRKT
jgi:hypothetical protein